MILGMMKELAEEALTRVRSDRSEAAEHGYISDHWNTAKSERIEADLEHLLKLISIEEKQREENGESVADEEPRKRPRGRYMGIAGGDIPKDEYYER